MGKKRYKKYLHVCYPASMRDSGPFLVSECGKKNPYLFAVTSMSNFIDQDGHQGIRVVGSNLDLAGPKDIWVEDGLVWTGRHKIQAWRYMKDQAFATGKEAGWWVEARVPPATQNLAAGMIPTRRYKRRAAMSGPMSPAEVITLYLLPVKSTSVSELRQSHQ